MGEQSDRAFGEAAIERGFITKAQLNEYLKLAAAVTQAGLSKSLSDVLLDKGALTEFQVELIRRSLAAKGEGRIVGGFEILEKIGEGGMGAVYKAKQVSMDRVVALKLLPERLARDEKYTTRFLREARIAAKLDHVNIVRGIDVGRDGDDYYFAMEFVEGESVAGALEREGAMAEERALNIMAQIARALEHAWKLKLIHRDIKPDNILLAEGDVAKLADMGLAKQTGEDSTVLTQTGAIMGTPLYMSPEQAQGKKEVDVRTDIYSLGATFYRMVTGEAPFSGDTAAAVVIKHVTEEAVPAHERNPDVSKATSRVIAKMMEKTPDARYADPTKLLKALASAAEGRGPEPPEAEAGAQTLTTTADEVAADQRAMVRPRTKARAWVISGAIAGVLVAAIGVAALVLTSGPGEEEKAQAEREAIMALADEGQLQEALERAEGAALTFSETASCKWFRDKAEAMRTKMERAEAATAEKKRLEEEARKRDEERARREAARKAAQAERARLAALEKRLAQEGLLVEAARDGQAGKWREALEKYEEALRDAEGELRQKALAGLKEVKERLRVEEMVTAIIRETDAGRWREAWARITGAREAGIEDARLAGLSKRAAAHLGPQKTLTGPLGIELVLVPGGTFRMGSEGGEVDEKPVHAVTVSAFYIGRHEVARRQFGRPSAEGTGGGHLPAVSMSWEGASEFCRGLTEADPKHATYRLPTEAEWEYTARGAEGRAYPWGNEPPSDDRANLAGEADGHKGAAPVTASPGDVTPLGAHGLAGNVAEWCGDWYGPYSAPGGAEEKDPTGPKTGEMRVVRGGAFVMDASCARATARFCRDPASPASALGFRVVRELTEEGHRFLRVSGEVAGDD